MAEANKKSGLANGFSEHINLSASASCHCHPSGMAELLGVNFAPNQHYALDIGSSITLAIVANAPYCLPCQGEGIR
jgi:hypothetical protein